MKERTSVRARSSSLLFVEFGAGTSAMAEVQGIILAAELFQENEPADDMPLYFFTDNRAAIRVATGAKSPWWCEEEAKRLRELITELAKSRRVTCFWVPGHGKVEGNEIVDRLARRGATGVSSDDAAVVDDKFDIPKEDLISQNVLGDRSSPRLVKLIELLRFRAKKRPPRRLGGEDEASGFSGNLERGG